MPSFVGVAAPCARVAGCLLVGLAAGCGGGGGGDPAVALTVSGRVVDGPIAGARVCVDLDGDKRCGADEPDAASEGDGRFHIALGSVPSLPRPWTVLAEVDAVVARDVDDGGVTLAAAGKRSVTLAGLADEGAEAVLSPLTTLVVNRIERLGQSRPAAADEVAAALGLPAGADPEADYTDASDDASRVVANVARTVFLVTGEVREGFRLSGVAQAPAIRHRAVVEVAMQRAAELISAEGLAAPQVADLQARVLSRVSGERFAFAPDVIERMHAYGGSHLPASAVAGQVYRTFDAQGFGLACCFYASGALRFDAALSFTERLWVENRWEDAEVSEAARLELAAATGDWQPQPAHGVLGAFAAAADGSGVLTLAHSGVRWRYRFARFEVAGQRLSEVEGWLQASVAPGGDDGDTRVFPAGAALVRYELDQLDDNVWLHAGADLSGSGVTTLDGWIAQHPTPEVPPARDADLASFPLGDHALTFDTPGPSGTVTSWNIQFFPVVDPDRAPGALRQGVFERVSLSGTPAIEFTGLGAGGPYCVSICTGFNDDIYGGMLIVAQGGVLRTGKRDRAGKVPAPPRFALNAVAWEAIRAWRGLPE